MSKHSQNICLKNLKTSLNFTIISMHFFLKIFINYCIKFFFYQVLVFRNFLTIINVFKKKIIIQLFINSGDSELGLTREWSEPTGRIGK